MNQSNLGNTENVKEIEIYVYDKKVINTVISMLKKVKIEGFEQAQLLSELGRLICCPIKEDTLLCDLEEYE